MIERRIRRSGEVVWRVRWRDHLGRNRSREIGSKREAQAFDDEMRRRRRTGELALFDAGRETLDEYVIGTWVRSTRRIWRRVHGRSTRAHTTGTLRRGLGERHCGRSTLRRWARFRAI
jgi:hypothetical protein